MSTVSGSLSRGAIYNPSLFLTLYFQSIWRSFTSTFKIYLESNHISYLPVSTLVQANIIYTLDY